MKRLASLLLLFALVGCRNDGIAPGLLYRRWQLLGYRSVDKPVIRADSTRITIITFKPSGEYRYEFNGRQYTCCQPNRFIRRENQLLFSTVAGGYVSPECFYTLCAPYKPEQTIYSLSAQELVLSYNNVQTVYKAVF